MPFLLSPKMSFIPENPENSPECLSERDPATIYGPMGAHVPKYYKPGDAMKAGLQGQDIPDYCKQAPPPVATPKNPYQPGTVAHQRWELETALALLERERQTDPPPEKWEGVGFLPVPGTVEAKVTSPYPSHATAHIPRIIEISISSVDPNIQWRISSKLRFSDLSSHTQAEAIWTTIQELNARMSAAARPMSSPTP
jgi:hypothetical protein